jgi:uncharacterized protein with von Willebrand factor type A (vWA) domain/radical SAM superfamily enzyme YgiQ (UPF0313 family)
MQKCLLISFDFSKEKDGYPSISYSVASILAKFKESNLVDIEQFSCDMRNYLETQPEEFESHIMEEFRNKFMDKINDYSFIALSAYAWSEKIVNDYISMLHSFFNGKIILGGYEITALNEEKLLKIYPNVDYYVKGYAEKSLEMIFKNEAAQNILDIAITDAELVSPYLSKILQLDTKKIYWESKRGCPYKCDFCEWGNAGKEKIIRINDTRIDNEIALFKQEKIQCVNVLDPTFLLNEEDIKTLEKLLSINNCEIHLQVHFAPIKETLKEKFFALCRRYRDRIFLEFGLQTIHEEEMNILKRKNNMEHIEAVMIELNRLNVNYELSIIFGIPGQTVASFKDTIAFIEKNGCKKFRAFPLSLPQNSTMKKRTKELKIKETPSPYDAPSLKFVTESYSFTYTDWEEMYSIANRYNKKQNPQEFLNRAIVPIIEKAVYSYFNGGLQNVIASNANINSLLDRKIKEKLYMRILEYLQGSDAQNIVFYGFGIDSFSSAIKNILSNETMRELCAMDISLAEHITKDLLDFINKTKRQILINEHPYEEERQLLENFKRLSLEGFEKGWKITAPFIQVTYPQNIDTDFYHDEFQKSLDPVKKDNKSISFLSVKEHFTDRWEKLLFEKELHWELEIIEEQRKQFCEELYKQIEQLKQLQGLLEPFTNELGRLWDMSRGRWQKVNFDILKKYAELLERDKSLQELVEMLGRMRQAEREYEEAIFADMVIKPTWKVEHAAKSELVGIHESDDISSMLPAEAALLANEKTEPLFYKKFIEKKLQTFEYQAKVLSWEEEEIKKKRQKEKEEKKGPFIICVDVSGSMHGTPETVAKILCFALLKMAVRDNRKCYLISFSTAIETLNLTDLKNNLEKLIEFLSMSFYGGTDAGPAMHEALRMLKTEDYKKADVVMVSDFVMSGFDEQTKNQIIAAKEGKTRFHSLVIGNSGNNNTIEEFNTNWAYNTTNKDCVLQLVRDIHAIN